MAEQTMPLEWIAVAICMILLIYIVIKVIKRDNPFFCKKTFLDIIFIIYFTFLVSIVFFPIRYVYESQFMQDFPLEAYVQYIPFKTTASYFEYFDLSSMIQFCGNVVLLIPLAVYINLIKEWTIKQNLFFALLFSVGIECIQAVINLWAHWPNNVTDIDDVIWNVVGYMLVLFIMPWLKKKYETI